MGRQPGLGRSLPLLVRARMWATRVSVAVAVVPQPVLAGVRLVVTGADAAVAAVQLLLPAEQASWHAVPMVGALRCLRRRPNQAHCTRPTGPSEEVRGPVAGPAAARVVAPSVAWAMAVAAHGEPGVAEVVEVAAPMVGSGLGQARTERAAPLSVVALWLGKVGEASEVARCLVPCQRMQMVEA